MRLISCRTFQLQVTFFGQIAFSVPDFRSENLESVPRVTTCVSKTLRKNENVLKSAFGGLQLRSLIWTSLNDYVP